jgi:hypothetical protein
VFKSALDDENARKFAAGGVLPFLLSNALSLCSPAGKRETDTEREFMKLCVNILISHFATLWEKKENKKQEKKLLIEWKSCHTLRALAPHALAFKHTKTPSRARARLFAFIHLSFSLSLSLSLSFCRASGGDFTHKKGDTTPKKKRIIEKKNHCDGGEENDDDSSARSSTFFFVFFFVGREKTRIRFFLPRVRRARFIGASREATRAANRFFFL